ncbi:MAG TPA: ribonuclease P protein component 1 [Candidatus Krumholzibacteriaceae bacterium]|jgi:ribonuclease P protein subunit POP4|nr:ribonuclease P protein component 1 [Candidatus Krumholzibacteriaceae bacterium]
MKITPAIIQGEFIGLDAKITKNNNPSLVKMKGKIINETRNTFVILQEGKQKIIPKDTSVFHFIMQDRTVVEIDGKLLLGRPEDRVKKRIRRLW